MSEEVKIKISQPMFEIGELERFDNNIHSIVEEYSKLMFKEKDQILTQRIIMKQEEEIERLKEENKRLNKEIDRLNNIINELERLLQQDLENEKDTYWTNITKEDYIQFMLNKLQELKGSEINEYY